MAKLPIGCAPAGRPAHTAIQARPTEIQIPGCILCFIISDLPEAPTPDPSPKNRGGGAKLLSCTFASLPRQSPSSLEPSERLGDSPLYHKARGGTVAIASASACRQESVQAYFFVPPP